MTVHPPQAGDSDPDAGCRPGSETRAGTSTQLSFCGPSELTQAGSSPSPGRAVDDLAHRGRRGALVQLRLRLHVIRDVHWSGQVTVGNCDVHWQIASER